MERPGLVGDLGHQWPRCLRLVPFVEQQIGLIVVQPGQADLVAARFQGQTRIGVVELGGGQLMPLQGEPATRYQKAPEQVALLRVLRRREQGHSLVVGALRQIEFETLETHLAQDMKHARAADFVVRDPGIGAECGELCQWTLDLARGELDLGPFENHLGLQRELGASLVEQALGLFQVVGQGRCPHPLQQLTKR